MCHACRARQLPAVLGKLGLVLVWPLASAPSAGCAPVPAVHILSGVAVGLLGKDRVGYGRVCLISYPTLPRRGRRRAQPTRSRTCAMLWCACGPVCREQQCRFACCTLTDLDCHHVMPLAGLQRAVI